MITIGKLAALFGITHHQIRYYEDKHIFLPSQVDENGYRMYDLDGVYRLAQILLLRELELSVPQIKSVQVDYSEQDYQKLISEKINDIETTIVKLAQTKTQLERQLTNNRVADKKRVELPGFELEKLLTLKLSEKLTADNLVTVVGLKRLLTENMYYLFEHDYYHICAKGERKTPDTLSFSPASYLVYTDYIESEEEADQKLIELSEKHQRYPDFVLEKHALTINQVSKVETAYYFDLAHEEQGR